MDSNSFKTLFLFCLFSMLCCACGEYEKLEIEKEAIRLSDSIYRTHRDSLSVIFDDACYANRDSLYKIYFDSLRELEAEKIKQLIKK